MGQGATPVLAATLAVGYVLAAVLVPSLLAPLLVVAVLSACAIVLTVRRSRALVLAVAAIGIWLTLSLAGTWLVRGLPRLGPLWLLVVVFLLPLPLLPWLYWATFRPGHGPRATGQDEERAP